MRLQSFNPTTLPGFTYAGKATIGMNFKNGLFNFSKMAIERLKLSNGSNVEFHQDEDDPANWYIEVHLQDSTSNGFTLRKGKERSILFFNHSHLARLIRDCFEHDTDPSSAKFRIADEPIDFEGRQFYGIIITTSSFKY